VRGVFLAKAEMARGGAVPSTRHTPPHTRRSDTIPADDA
jgi:hypothetical protein